jgi:hypothetical protein
MKKRCIFLAFIGTVAIVYLFEPKIDTLWCHSPNLVERKYISQPSFASDNQHVVFGVFHDSYREAIGICAFPDGGTNRIVSQKITIYTISLSGGKPEILAEATLPRGSNENASGSNNFVVWGLDQNFVAVSTSGNRYLINIKEQRIWPVKLTSVLNKKEIGLGLFKENWYDDQTLTSDKSTTVTYRDIEGIALYKKEFYEVSPGVMIERGGSNKVFRVLVDPLTLETL